MKMRFPNITEIRPYEICIYGIIIISLLGSYPYVFCQFLPLPPISIIIVASILLLFLVSIRFKSKLKPLPKIFNQIIIIQVLVWLIYCILHKDSTYITRITYAFSCYLSLMCLHNCQNGILNFFKNYNKWILTMALGGTVAFFLILAGILHPIFQFCNIDGRNAYFFGLTCTNFYFGNVIRYSGFFDEPGAMAFWGIWALVFNKLFYKNTKFELCLSFCLIFTLSLAYYIQFIIYIISFKVKSTKQILGIVLLFSSLVGIIFYSEDTDYDIYKYTLYRLEANSSGSINGDNRSDLMEISKKTFLQSPIIGVGAYNAIANMDYMGDNPYMNLAYDGILGTITLYLPLLSLWLFSNDNRDIRLSIIILFIGYLQRPISVFFITFFMLYAFFLLGLYDNMRRSDNKQRLQMN